MENNFLKVYIYVCVYMYICKTSRTAYNSPGQNTGVGSHSLLQGIFPTQGSNPSLPHCRWILYQLSHKESPRILEWVAYHFSRGSSWLRNQIGVSCIAGRLFTSWVIREDLHIYIHIRTHTHTHMCIYIYIYIYIYVCVCAVTMLY